MPDLHRNLLVVTRADSFDYTEERSFRESEAVSQEVPGWSSYSPQMP